MIFRLLKTSSLLIFILLLQCSSFSQTEIDGYKIIYLERGPSNIVDYTAKKFEQFGLRVHTSQTTLKNDELFNTDRGLALSCNFEHNYNYPHTWIRISLYNTNNELIYQKEDNTRGKTFTSFSVKKDQRWVVDKLLKPLSNYKFRSDKTLKSEFINNLPKREVLDYDEEALKTYYDNNKTDPIEGIYELISGGGGYYYKLGIIIDEGIYKALLVETDAEHWERGEVKAEFEKGALQGVFATTWYMSDKSPYKTYSKLSKENLLSINLIDESGNDIFFEYLKIYPKSNSAQRQGNKSGVSRGSGFVLNEDGYIATNAHVIKNQTNKVNVTLVNDFGTSTFITETILIDEENDIAIIKINDSTFTGFNAPPYAFSTGLSSGEDCFTIGYPMSKILGSNYKVTSGIISSTSGPKDNPNLIQTTTPIQPGNSGGPLFNEVGDIVGITMGTLNSKGFNYKTQNINYAIKISILLELIDNELDLANFNMSNQIGQTKRSEIVKSVKSYVCLIEVSN